MVAANAGSCDLGVLDVTSALKLGEAARIARIPISNAAGELMLLRYDSTGISTESAGASEALVA